MPDANKILSCLTITAFFLLFIGISFAQPAVPPYIHYQGRLVDQATGAPINDTKSITFSLYDSETGEAAIYYQIQEVAINEGVFSVYLGKGEGYYDGNQVADGIPAEVFTDYSARYLGIKLEDSQIEMYPRQLITSAAYAYKAERASKADYAMKAGEAENLMGQVTVSPSGNVGIGTANPGGLLDVGGGNLVVDPNTGNVGIGTTSPGRPLHISNNAAGIRLTDNIIGYSYDITSHVASNDGKMCIGKVGEGVGTLVINLNGGNVGIGTMSPDDNLHVVNNISVGGTSDGDGDITLKDESGNQKIQLDAAGATAGSGSTTVYLSGAGDSYITSGNFGIGTTNPRHKLHINTPRTGDPVAIALDSGGWSGEIKNSGSQGMVYHTESGDHAFTTYTQDRKFIIKGGTGNVGIGTTSPSYKLHVNGTAYATGAAGALSDRRSKTNINDLSFDALEVINDLHPVTFEWKEPLDSGMEGTQLGFIAQEVEEVLPEAVLTQDNEEQTKGLKYNALIPLLTKAIQELEAQNKALKAENNSLRYEIDQIKEVIGLKRHKGDVVN